MKKLFINLTSVLYIFLSGILIAFSFFALYMAGVFNIHMKQLILFLVLGIVIGFMYVLIGIILFHYCNLWRHSMEYLEKKVLLKGSIFYLFVVSFIAGLIEEAYTRGIFLLFYLKNPIFPGLNINGLIIIALVLNLLWTISHIFNDKTNLIDRPFHAIKQATPHLIVIFLSGIPWYVITLTTSSIIPAIASHFVLDFVIGIFYRKKNYEFSKHDISILFK